MNKIISLTPAAINRVNKLLQKENTGSVFRVGVDKSGCSGWKYVVAIVPAAKKNDQAIKINDHLTVYVDHDSIDILKDSTLDCEEKGMGMWQWVFHNPKAKNNCGCGESFSIEENDK